MEQETFEMPKIAELFERLNERIENFYGYKKKIKKEDIVMAKNELYDSLCNLEPIDLKIIYYIHHLKSIYPVQFYTFLRRIYKAENAWEAIAKGEEFIDFIFSCC